MSKIRKVRWDRVAVMVAIPLSIMAVSHKKTAYIEQHTPVVTITNPATEEVAESLKMDEYVSLGQFRISYYCGGECCNGKWAGISASGKELKPGMVAMDKSFDFGTTIYMNEDGVMNEYVCEDRGGAITGRRIDVYCSDHKTATQLGVIYTEVFVKK